MIPMQIYWLYWLGVDGGKSNPWVGDNLNYVSKALIISYKLIFMFNMVLACHSQITYNNLQKEVILVNPFLNDTR
jgi:hypothetical protein